MGWPRPTHYGLGGPTLSLFSPFSMFLSPNSDLIYVGESERDFVSIVVCSKMLGALCLFAFVIVLNFTDH
jgi:hypothetical protein